MRGRIGLAGVVALGLGAAGPLPAQTKAEAGLPGRPSMGRPSPKIPKKVGLPGRTATLSTQLRVGSVSRRRGTQAGEQRAAQ